MSKLLDELAEIDVMQRETYCSGYLPKPNDHCNLVDKGLWIPDLVWEENDEHFRVRVIQILKGEVNE